MFHSFKSALLFVAAFWGCNVSAQTKIPVVASFSILGDIVQVVGGDRVSVSTLVGPNQDAHVFEASPADVKKIMQSRLLVSNGLGFDPWINKLEKSAGYKGLAIAAANGITARKIPADPAKHSHGPGKHSHSSDIDPHAWQNPQNVAVYAKNIANALVKIDPDGKAVYEQNTKAYLAALEELDAWAKSQFDAVPTAKRKVITAHDAFGYLGDRYGITFLAPQGVTTNSEPSAKQVGLLIRQIKREGIRAVHIENMSNPRLLQQLSAEAGVTAGGRLYSDALSEPGGAADSYLKLMRFNVAQLAQSLKLN